RQGAGQQEPGRSVSRAQPDDLGGKDQTHVAARCPMSKKRAGLPSMSDACHDEATAAFAQARTSKHRARMLRVVAAARRAGALLDVERGTGLRREAVLCGREAVNHVGMARVYEVVEQRAESLASA